MNINKYIFWQSAVIFVATLPTIGYAQYYEQLAPVDGVTLYKQSGQVAPDYILEINLRKTNLHSAFGDVLRVDQGSFGGRNPHYEAKSISNGEFKLPNGETPIAISSGMFGGGWTSGYKSGYVAFPVRARGYLETEGYGDPSGNNPEKATSDYKVLCINNEQANANIYDYYRLDQVQKCPDELVSFNKDVYKDDTRGKTFIGVTDRDNDGYNETILIYSTSFASRAEADQNLRNFGAIDTMQFDGGGSSQLRVGDKNFVSSTRTVWHALVVGQKASSTTPVDAGIFDGAGSLINPSQNCYGCDRDIAVMHPHPGTGSTVVFQWLYDNSKCEFLDLTANSDIGVVIKAKAWSEHLTQKAFKTTLSSTPISLKRSGDWTTFAITSESSISNEVWITAQCRKPNDTFYNGSTQSVAKNLVDVTYDYYWTGTGSIISQANRAGYGVDYDIATTFSTKNSLTSFQWYSSSKCHKLEVSDGSSTFHNASVSVKLWNDKNFSQVCSSLPCTITKSDGYYVIKVKSDANEFNGGTIQAACR